MAESNPQVLTPVYSTGILSKPDEFRGLRVFLILLIIDFYIIFNNSQSENKYIFGAILQEKLLMDY